MRLISIDLFFSVRLPDFVPIFKATTSTYLAIILSLKEAPSSFPGVLIATDSFSDCAFLKTQVSCRHL